MFKFLRLLFILPFLVLHSSSAENRNVKPEQFQQNAQYSRELKGDIQLSGAFALYPMIVRWADEFRKIHPKVRIDISAGGAGKGITDALANVVDLGMVSREIHQTELNKGAFAIPVARDAVVVTINSGNPLYDQIMKTGLKRGKAIGLWKTHTIKTWGEVIGTSSTIPVHTYTRSDACGAADTWASYLGIAQEDLEGTAVFGDPGIASVIQRDKVGIGFNNISYAYNLKTKLPHKNIAVMPLDLNSNGRIDPEEDFYRSLNTLNEAIADGRYPSPPARKLYLVSNGKPRNEIVVSFLIFILTKGQQWTAESGFVGLQDDELTRQIERLQ